MPHSASTFITLSLVHPTLGQAANTKLTLILINPVGYSLFTEEQLGELSLLHNEF